MTEKIDALSQVDKEEEAPKIRTKFTVYETEDGTVGFNSGEEKIDLLKVFNMVTILAGFLQMQLQTNMTVNTFIAVQKRLQEEHEANQFAKKVINSGRRSS